MTFTSQAGLHLFVEKPISIKSAEEVARLAAELGQIQKEQGLVIGVGYMLRYSSAIQVHTAKDGLITCSVYTSRCITPGQRLLHLRNTAYML